MSFALALDLDATATVLARSAAEIPVVMPEAASIETVKPVPCPLLLSLTIWLRSNASHFF